MLDVTNGRSVGWRMRENLITFWRYPAA